MNTQVLNQEIRAREEPTPKNGAALGRLKNGESARRNELKNDGTPYALKGASTVWSGGKGGATSKPYLSLCVGNRRYLEIEFALPNELQTVEQYRQIIDAFIEKHLKNHYYAYTIHNKIGTMSNGQHHSHVHIMFSERLIDEVEKIKERAACNFFKYPARKKKDGSEPSFQEKYKRGAPKNRLGAEKSFLFVIRADFAKIQNEVLAKNGFSIRVDHRTLQAPKETVKQNRNTSLDRFFNHIPEEYIGVIQQI